MQLHKLRIFFFKTNFTGKQIRSVCLKRFIVFYKSSNFYSKLILTGLCTNDIAKKKPLCMSETFYLFLKVIFVQLEEHGRVMKIYVKVTMYDVTSQTEEPLSNYI